MEISLDSLFARIGRQVVLADLAQGQLAEKDAQLKVLDAEVMRLRDKYETPPVLPVAEVPAPKRRR